MGGNPAAIVGRDDELRAIRDAVDAARAGQGGSIFLAGESGIGKSRLLAAAVDMGDAAGMRLLRGRASAVGPTVPYRPLTEALLSLLRSGVEFDDTALGSYRPVLARLVPDLGQQAPASDCSPVLLAEAFLRLAASAGHEHGCLITLDDLQDADVETLAVVEYLIDNLEQQPVLLLGTCREEPPSALHLARSTGQRRTGELVRLGPLGEPAIRTLAGRRLGVAPHEVPEPAVALLLAGSAGNPLYAGELVTGMVDSGFLATDGAGWTVADQDAKPPLTFAHCVARRFERLPPRAGEVLSVAAVFGRRFPLAVTQAVTGLSDRELRSYLHDEPGSLLVQPDEQQPGWYLFHHQLVREAVLTLLTPVARARLAGAAADAVEAVYPGLPGEWCQTAAALRLSAGDAVPAGRLIAEVGRRALTQGAANSAVELLDDAWELLTEAGAAERADVLEHLLYALAEAGLVDRAMASIDKLDEVGGLDPRRKARLHTKLAWAAQIAVSGQHRLAQIAAARALLGPDADEADTAPIDVVEAHIILDLHGPDQIDKARDLCRRAAEVADRVPLPVVACQAWQLLGALVRPHDPDEATACLERALDTATRHDLPIWQIHALVRLGNDDAMRNGSRDRLEEARTRATAAGAVVARYQAEQSIALFHVLEGAFAAAEALVDQVLAATVRIKIVECVHYTLLVRAMLAAHQGRRHEMDEALARFRYWKGHTVPFYAPRIHGLARTVCALLEEDREQAIEEQARALRAEDATPTVLKFSGRYGLNLLLGALTGTLTQAGFDALADSPAAGLRWDRMFAQFGRAVLAGRSGAVDEADLAVADALSTGAPYAMGRHLGLRLVAEAAITDRWGTPVEWLHDAEAYFRGAGVVAVADACAEMAGRVTGNVRVPSSLCTAGVTAREYEVLRLVGKRLRNREIAEELHLSQRTVETHVSSLLAKTGLPNRIELSKFVPTLDHS